MPEIQPIYTTAWFDGGDLLLRTEEPGSEAFLIRHLTGSERTLYDYGKPVNEGDPNKTVYRYKPNQNTLEAVRFAEWVLASGKVVDSGRNSLTDISPFRWSGRTLTLHFKGTIAKTIGPVVTDVTLSPDGALLAVLSAEGPYRPSPVPFLGGGTIGGARYYELLRITDGSRQGEAYRFAFGRPESPPMGGCWTADGRFVVYGDRASRLWIIPVPEDPSQRRQSP